MIVITGAAGFIGSVLVRKLNDERFFDLVLVDDFSKQVKAPNYKEKKYSHLLNRKDMISFLKENHRLVQFVFHLGARTDTTEFNKAVFDELNLNYSKDVWKACVEYGLPLVYASSAATYGLGEEGYDDREDLISRLKPLNPYGESKNDFDNWALLQEKKPYYWTGLKFFNVYGPNEYHKGRMASVIFHTFNQVKATGKMNLFRSHKAEYKDGGQMRDFVYVKDVAEVLFFLLHHRKNSGIYNLGTGKARAFLDLARATFRAMHISENIGFIDTPEDIRDKYQYFTEAPMKKLRSIGYTAPFRTLEEGIADYVVNYLGTQSYY
jgi:ADP-L-glycero-D-manno-heptose 6-epimerase